MVVRARHDNDAATEATWLFVLPWELAAERGVDQVVLNMMTEFSITHGMRPATLVSDWGAADPQFSRIQGYDSVSLRLHPVCREGKVWRSFVGFVWQLPKALLHLRDILRSWNVQVVNYHYVGLHALVFVILKKLRLWRAPLIFSVHGMDITQAGGTKGALRLVWKVLLNNADAIVACSQSLSRAVIAIAPEAAPRVHVIHNGISPERFLSEASAIFNLPAGVRERRYILCVAAFEKKKGIDVLVDAFSRIARLYPDLQLVLVGNGGDQRSQIGALVTQFCLSDRVHIFEDLPHGTVGAFMRTALVFVLPSREEPFGIVLLEAGAYALPVVATNTGGIPEIIENGVHGTLVPVESPPELATAILRMIEDPDRARELARRFNERVKNEFSWRSAAKRYLEISNRQRLADESHTNAPER